MAWATRHKCWLNGVSLVLLALSAIPCANAENTDNANNASLPAPPNGPYYDQTQTIQSTMDTTVQKRHHCATVTLLLLSVVFLRKGQWVHFFRTEERVNSVLPSDHRFNRFTRI